MKTDLEKFMALVSATGTNHTIRRRVENTTLEVFNDPVLVLLFKSVDGSLLSAYRRDREASL